MAFLCPVRIRRGKKNKSGGDAAEPELRGGAGAGAAGGLGRITGSASIETLVRVGLEKELGLGPDCKVLVLHDFTPYVDDELEVKRGQVVSVLYREHDWVYVIAESRREGFIPHSYCAPAPAAAPAPPSPRGKRASPPPSPRGKRSQRDASQLSVSDGGSASRGGGSEAGSEGSACAFSKDPSGRYVVLYTFAARDENDVDVERGEFVTVLNREDPDWYWIVRSDGQEGFIPSGFVYPAGGAAGGAAGGPSAPAPAAAPAPAPAAASAAPDCEGRYLGTELVMLYDYKAQAPDDLSARRGEWLFADLAAQTVEGWLWAHAPKSRRSGFIPTAYARAPHTTQL